MNSFLWLRPATRHRRLASHFDLWRCAHAYGLLEKQRQHFWFQPLLLKSIFCCQHAKTQKNAHHTEHCLRLNMVVQKPEITGLVHTFWSASKNCCSCNLDIALDHAGSISFNCSVLNTSSSWESSTMFLLWFIVANFWACLWLFDWGQAQLLVDSRVGGQRKVTDSEPGVQKWFTPVVLHNRSAWLANYRQANRKAVSTQPNCCGQITGCVYCTFYCWCSRNNGELY